MKWKKIKKETYNLILNENGATIGYSDTSGIKLIEEDGFLFKDLDGSGVLDDYKDWRKSPSERASDLAKKLPIEVIAGLMLYSRHQTVIEESSKYERLFGANTYNGENFKNSNAKVWDLTDQQKEFLKNDHLRHILVSSVKDAESAAKWSNNIQAFVEGIGWGIPVNISSDPRHEIKGDAEYNLGSGSDISKWPTQVGLAATFDPKIVEEFGKIVSKEYRLLGIGTALSPQADLGTEPRWSRFAGTFGEDTKLVTDMVRAYCDGIQSSEKESEICSGWGYDSVNAMVKHWPGGGTGEGGRDAHFTYGKYAVYPGNNINEHIKPFINGAFNLNGGTEKASAVMPYYTVSFGQDKDENVGNSYSKYIITDLLREKYKYNGVVCTDWLITADHGPKVSTFSGKCWGVENLTVAERHLKALVAGVDQFGGNNEVGPLLEAYEIGKKIYGEDAMRKRFELSAERLLLNMFRIGLFDNPYINIEDTKKIVGCNEFVEKGYEAQLKSIVMLKNKNKILPISLKKRVYIPKKKVEKHKDWFGNVVEEKDKYPINLDILKKYYIITDNYEEADFAIVFVDSPKSNGYSDKDLKEGDNGYIPISLQYRPYCALESRDTSIAGGDPLEKSNDRSYKGKWSKVENESDLDAILHTKDVMEDKPVIVVMHMKKPAIVKEFESSVDGILINFGVSDEAILDIISGIHEPSALLPFQVPKDMKTVEEQFEDVAYDMNCHISEEGYKYNFGFGLNWSGIINDERTNKYRQTND